MEPQTIKTIAGWMEGRLERGDPETEIRGISIDSRTVEPGDLFVAIGGENFDGHKFAVAALEAGAAGAVISRPVAPLDRRPGGFVLIRVEETRRALASLARGYRGLFRPRAIAVTGSNGKTTTKDLIGLILSAGMETLAAPASYNNPIGVSLTILMLAPRHRAAVFELGTNRPGEIRELARLCRPDLAVITNIGPAHLGPLGGLEGVAREKGSLLEELEGEGTAFLNIDDPRLAELAGRFPGEAVGYGFGPVARVRGSDPVIHPGGARFRVSLPGGEIEIDSPLPGRHNVLNLLAALAVGDRLGVDPEAMRRAVRSARLPAGRLERFLFAGAEVINDAYNANPVSMAAGLTTWLGMECRGRRIVVSGDMNELGEHSGSAHREWGERLGRSGIDIIIFLGPLSREAAAAARAAGGGEVITVDDCPRAAEVLAGLIRPGDSVLLKGSRKMGMEEIVDILKNRDKTA